MGGTAETTYTAGTSPGFDTVSAIVDGQAVDTVIEIVGGAAPILRTPDEIPSAQGLPVRVPVELDKNGNDITAVAFSVDFDPGCLGFNDSEGDGDGIPDGTSPLRAGRRLPSGPWLPRMPWHFSDLSTTPNRSRQLG